MERNKEKERKKWKYGKNEADGVTVRKKERNKERKKERKKEWKEIKKKKERN